MNARGVNLDGPSVGIGCVLGLAAGAAGCFGLYRMVLLPKLQARIDAEVDDRVNAESAALRSHFEAQYSNKLKAALAPAVAGQDGTDGNADSKQATVGRQPERRPVTDYASISIDRTLSGPPLPEDPALESVDEGVDNQHTDAAGTADSGPAEAHNVFDDYPAGNNPKIRRATREELGELPPGYTTEVLHWYAGDGVLTDENDDPIRNPLDLIGTEKPGFGYLREDPHVYLVINEELDLAIEVIYKEMAWVDVLGYQDPSKERTAPTKEG